MSSNAPLSDVLDRIGGEIERIANRLRTLTIPAEFAAALPPDLLVTWQDIDASEQALRAFALVITRAAADPAALASVDVERLVSGLPLAGVVRTVRGTSEPDGATGELDLF